MIFEFSSFRVDTARREISSGSVAVSLQPRVLDLLIYLIENRERVVSKDELQQQVWGTVVGDAAIARSVTKLRKALGDPVQKPALVRTVRGRGYRFVASLNESDTPAPQIDASLRHPSVAVLPFVNMSDDPGADYFSDGITEEVINLLARVAELRVVSRTTSFAYRGRQKDIRTIAQEMDVGYILEGSVRRQPGRVRIVANLIHADSDSQVWNGAYDRQLTDVFGIQSEIAESIVAELQLATRDVDSNDPVTTNLEAYDFYLRGRHYFHKLDPTSLDYARQMFEQAIELDPVYARAWAGLAETLSHVYAWLDASEAHRARADEASLRALELAPELAEAHCARGFVLSSLGDYPAAADEFDAAIALDPMLFEAWCLYARSCVAAGLQQKAARLFARAADVRREDYQTRCLQSQSLAACGENDDAHDAATDAVRRCRRHLSLHPEDTRALTLGAGCLITLGERDEGLRWADRAIETRPQDVSTLHNAGCCYARAGEVERALDVFEVSFSKFHGLQDWIDNDPDFDNVRDHPRFQALLRRQSRGC